MQTFLLRDFRLWPHDRLLLLCFAFLFAPAAAQSTDCSTSFTVNNTNKLFTNCQALNVQSASIAWTLDAVNNTLEVLFSGVAPQPDGWVGWGINPGPQPAMAGTQAFVAFAAPNGSTILTYDVTDAAKDGGALVCTPISLQVLDMQVEIAGTSIVMLVAIQLQPNQSTTLNHVWNRGSSVSDFQPGPHGLSATDRAALRVIDMASGEGTSASVQRPDQLLRNRHGVLNTVGWGFLLPCGVMAARYLRFADPAWFYLHMFLQLSGYLLGTAGFATGLRLGRYSEGVVQHKHRNIGIALFVIATLQVAGASLLRPNKEHKKRKIWNWCHYTLGTTILVLGILNIFYGFDILSPPRRYCSAYVGILIALGALTICFEVLKWAFAFRKKRQLRANPKGAHVGGLHSLNGGVSQAMPLNGHKV